MKALALVVAVLALLGAGVWYATRPEPVAVRVHEVGRGPVAATVANTRVGTVEACRRARMSPAAAGQVARLYVKKGDRVQAGDLLLEIWNQDQEAELHLAEAEVIAADARIEEACSTAAGAQRDAKRSARLRREGVISEEAADSAATEAASRQAACIAARATAGVSRARVEVARQTLERTVLRAPFGGVVAEVDAKLGEFLTPSPPGIPTKPAIDLIDPDCLYVSAPIDEVDAPRIATGMPTCVSLDAFPDKLCDARVRRIAPYVQDLAKQARTVEVEVDLSAVAGREKLLPGYSADIEITVARHEDVLRVPSEAVLEGARVLVLDPTRGVLESRELELGLANWEFTEVRSGLSAGDLVVLSTGRTGVKAGARAVREREQEEP